MSEIINSNLSDRTKFRLNEINEIKDYFNSEIQEKEIMSKKLSKYNAVFYYVGKALIILSATSKGVSIISFASVIGLPAGIASASFTLVFSLTTGIIKKDMKKARNQNKKHNKTLVLLKSKLNSIKTLICQALIDLQISHEEFKTIIKEKEM